jgi:hypothetical protein
MGGIPEVTDVYKPDENANDCDNFGKHVTEVIKFAFEGSFLAYLSGNRFVNIADRCVLPGEHNNCVGIAIYNGCALYSYWLRREVEINRKQLTEKSMFVMSCLTALESEIIPMDLLTLTLSPVRMAWSTRKLLEDIERSLQSAGILSPTATDTMSPGTSCEAWMRAI